MEPQFKTKKLLKLTYHQKLLDEKLGETVSFKFKSLIRDLEAATDFRDMPTDPVQVSENHVVVLTYDLGGHTVLEIEPRHTRTMSEKPWNQAFRFFVRSIKKNNKDIA